MSLAKDTFLKAISLSPGKSLQISGLSELKRNNFRVALYRVKKELLDETVIISSNKNTLSLKKLTQEELDERNFDSIVINEIEEESFTITTNEESTPKKEKEKKLSPGQVELEKAQLEYIQQQERMTAFAISTNLKDQDQDSPDKIEYSNMQGLLDKIAKKIREIKSFYEIKHIPTPATIDELIEQEALFDQLMSDEEQARIKDLNKDIERNDRMLSIIGER